MSHSKRYLGGFFAFLLCVAMAWAQTETGQITGTVMDPTGAVVPNARVTLRGTATGFTREGATNQSGSYTFTNLLPGSYQITVAAPGFSTAQRQAVLAVGSRVGLDINLEVGQAETVVQVAENAALVNTENQTMANVITTRQLLDMPTLTRNPYSLVVTAGNVSESDASGTTPNNRGVGVAINGQRAASTNVLLDGASNNDEFQGGLGQQVPLDSVQELNVLTSNFTAEYGRASGGVVNVATKSGTNDFHGTAYEFNRVSRYTSNSFDNNANGINKPVFTRNQFGYSIGGPVIKDKLFFFQNTEWIRVRSAATRFVYIATPELLSAAAPATQQFFQTYGQFRNGVTPVETFSRNQLVGAGFDPCRGATAGGGCLSFNPNTPMFSKAAYNYAANSGGGDPQNSYMLVGRVDYNLSDKTQIYGRYALYHEEDFRGVNADSPYQGFDTGINYHNNNFLISAVRTFRPTLISQSKAVFNRLNQVQPLGDRPPVPTLYFNPTGPTSILGNHIALPGYLPFDPGSAIPFGGPQNFLQLYQDFSWIKGKHDFRFGGVFVHMQDNRTFGAYQEAVEALGTGSVAQGLDNLLAGQLYQFQAAIYPQGKFPCTGATPTPDCTITLPVGPPNFSRSNRYNEWAWYVQDSWKLRPRLTISLGLRWEYFGVQHNKDPRLDSNFYVGSGSNIEERVRNGSVQIAPDSPVGGLWKKDPDNFAPRIGFAWDVFGNGRTSLRGGYGIGYERNFGNVTFNVIQNPPNYAVISLIAGKDIPTIPISTSNAGPLAGSTGSKALPRLSVRNVDEGIETAYAQFYSFSLEHQFSQSSLLGISYSGSKGSRLYSLANVNAPGAGNIYLGDPCEPGTAGDPGTCVDRLNTQYGTMYRRGNLGFSRYNGLNARFEVRNIRQTGLSLISNYTWSHSIDNNSSTFTDTSPYVPSANNGYFEVGLLDYFHPSLDKGDSEWDVRHRIAISGVWEIPYARTGRSRYLLGGWTLAPIFTAHTGTPFSIFDCTYAANACPRAFFNGPMPREGASSPASSGAPNTFEYMALPTAQVVNYFNPLWGVSDYAPFPSNMSGRDVFRAPGWWNLDFAVLKTTRITERFSVQLRGETYNLFNHANLYVNGASADVSSTDFIPASRGSTGATFDRRNLQLALKLIF